ncbi:hypothetical protein [Streptomyces vilmorinianum]|uniref:hypothetical protein n=1 Tax=Streptomyces vilmorinianum TaxID=3051092 RepID=UPI0010FB8E68|nr:hypothetical protein [Streptomyces vilmorinianum]
MLGDGTIRLRATIHPEEIRIGGIPVMCPQCGARRDRMIVCNRIEIAGTSRSSGRWIDVLMPDAERRGLLPTPCEALVLSPKAE